MSRVKQLKVEDLGCIFYFRGARWRCTHQCTCIRTRCATCTPALMPALELRARCTKSEEWLELTASGLRPVPNPREDLNCDNTKASPVLTNPRREYRRETNTVPLVIRVRATRDPDPSHRLTARERLGGGKDDVHGPAARCPVSTGEPASDGMSLAITGARFPTACMTA